VLLSGGKLSVKAGDLAKAGFFFIKIILNFTLNFTENHQLITL